MTPAQAAHEKEAGGYGINRSSKKCDAMSDLDKLIEAVEAGDGDVMTTINRRMGSAAYDVGEFWRGHDIGKAFNGSLDAAMRLHEALLPGWTRDVDATAPECGITVTLHAPIGWPRHPDDDGAVCVDLSCEARAWLLAILRAVKAQGGRE